MFLHTYIILVHLKFLSILVWKWNYYVLHKHSIYQRLKNIYIRYFVEQRTEYYFVLLYVTYNK